MFSAIASSRIEGIAAKVAEKALRQWERPEGRRKSWRRKKPDGTYEYRDEPPEEKKPQRELKHRVTLSKDDLKHTLSKGHFTIISAGRNPNDPDEGKLQPDDEFFHQRHEELRDILEELGFEYTEVVGHYGGKESSFLVFHDPRELSPKTEKSLMVRHGNEGVLKARAAALEELGRHFKQDSVLHASAGKNTISFTSGKNAGKKCGGKGWKETPEAEDFFTDIELSGKNHTKFNLDIKDCFEQGFFASEGFERMILRIAEKILRVPPVR